MSTATAQRPPLGQARVATIRHELARMIATGQATLAPVVRPHPAGGHTIAVPVPGSIAARIYVGQFATPAAAMAASRALGRLEGEEMLAQLRATKVS